MVKLIILLFISINSYAQFKVEIVNKDGQSMSKECETQEKCDAYIARIEHKWGKKQRWQNKPCDKPENQIEVRNITEEIPVFDTREVEVLNEETQEMETIQEQYQSGTDTVVIDKEYHCKKNYSVNVKDISVEVEAKKAKKLKGESDLGDLLAKIKDKSAKLKDLLEYIIIKDGL